MKYWKKILLFLPLFVLYLQNPTPLTAQSRYLEGGVGGSSFQFNTELNVYSFVAAGVTAMYSIGGIMDIGFNLNREIEKIDDYEYSGWDFNILYNLVVIKQREYVPVSMQLEASYGYSNFSEKDDTSDDPDQKGYGFTVGASVYREFFRYNLFSFLIGAKGFYKNYLITDTNDNSSRSEQLYFGGIGAVTMRPDQWPYLTFEMELLYNESGGLRFVPSIIVTTPDF